MAFDAAALLAQLGANASGNQTDAVLRAVIAALDSASLGSAAAVVPDFWSDSTPKPEDLTASDIVGFEESVQDIVVDMLVAGTNVTLSLDRATNRITISSSGGGGGGGGTGTYKRWDPDKPQTAPSALDLEFATDDTIAAMPAAWTAFGGGWDSAEFPAVTPGGLTGVMIGNTYRGWNAPIPAGDFNIAVRCALHGPGSNFGMVGVGLGDGLNANAGNTVQQLIGYNTFATGAGWYVGHTTNGVQTFAEPNQAPHRSTILTMRRSVANYYYGFSFDGRRFYEVGPYTYAWVPAYFHILGFGGVGFIQDLRWLRYRALGAAGAWGGVRTISTA